MEALRKYFTGPVLLSSITGAIICALAFIGRDMSEPMTIPLLTFLCGLTTLGAGIWGGLKTIGDKTNVYRAIGPKTRHIISFSSEQFTSMALAAKEITIPGEQSPTEDQLRIIFSKLNPRDASPSGSVQTGRMLNRSLTLPGGPAFGNPRKCCIAL